MVRGCDAELIKHLCPGPGFDSIPSFSTAAKLDLPALHHLHSHLRGVDKSVSGNWNTAGGAIKAHARLAAPKTPKRC